MKNSSSIPWKIPAPESKPRFFPHPSKGQIIQFPLIFSRTFNILFPHVPIYGGGERGQMRRQKLSDRVHYSRA